MTDTQLLDHYVAEGDEVAFRALVVRHGPTVMKACRRILRDPHEIEDAFQASFLVLVRKAPTIRDPDGLGNWLHGVARRVALRAWRGESKRRMHEQRRAEMQPSRDDAPDPAWDDLGRAVREELAQLPRPYRAPLELCYLRGMSHEEAAEELGWPLGTVKTRLVRGRRRLRERLDRRGVALGAALLLLFLPRRGPAAATDRLVETTVEAMVLERSGGAALDPRFARASSLAWELLEAAARPRWVWPLLGLLALSLGASRGVAAYSERRAAEFEAFAALAPGLTDVLNVDCP